MNLMSKSNMIMFVFIVVVMILVIIWRKVGTIVLVSKKTYYETLNILRGRTELLPIFRKLKEFIQSKYDVTVYNFVFEKQNHMKRFRLYVLLATAEDFKKMFGEESAYKLYDKDTPKEAIEKLFGENEYLLRNYDKSIQKAIAEKFFELANKYNYGKPKSREDVFVCYNDFSSEIKTVINWKAIKKARELILKKYATSRVWDVVSCLESSVVFFCSDEDLKNSADIRTQIEDDYFSLLKPHDEFDVFDRSRFSLKFDSKQNLDENYQGSLYYYFH